MHSDESVHRALVIQLARLGDMVQSLPAITALKAHTGIAALDVLCPAPLASIGSCIGGVDRVLAWEVERWRVWADRWASAPEATLAHIGTYLQEVMPKPYGVAFNLNQHSRAILTATLLSHQVIGPGESGPLTAALPPWADYLCGIARDRNRNRVHLADIFCGLCGVVPPGRAPRLRIPATGVPEDLTSIGKGDGPWVAVVVGAGDPARCVPPAVWREWIGALLEASPSGQVVLVGSSSECECAGSIQDGLSSLCLGRVWDVTGRTTLMQTATLLGRCHWVVGSDTGPLHLGTAVGARAMGFYFARARVHETGPYGDGHWVWQADLPAGSVAGGHGRGITPESINRWPIAESLRLMIEGQHAPCEGWTLWESHLDGWGAYYDEAGTVPHPDHQREDVWRRLHPPKQVYTRSHEYI